MFLTGIKEAVTVHEGTVTDPLVGWRRRRGPCHGGEERGVIIFSKRVLI